MYNLRCCNAFTLYNRPFIGSFTRNPNRSRFLCTRSLERRGSMKHGVFHSIAVITILLAGPVFAKGPPYLDRPHHWDTVYQTPGHCVTGAAYGDGLLFLADREMDRIYAIDPVTGEIEREFPTPGYIPQGLAFDGTYLWVADAEENVIFRMDPSDGTVSRVLWSPAGSVAGLAYDGTDLWVADRPGKMLYRVSTVDGTSISKIPAPSKRTTGMTWDGSHLWVADRVNDEVYRVDPENGNVILTLQAAGKHVWGLAWDGSRLYSTDYQSDRIFHLVPKELPPFSRLEDRRERITFHHEVRSHGPEPILDAAIAIAIPRNRPGQEIVGSIAFEPEPDEVVEDSWGQKLARFRFENIPAPGKVSAVMRMEAHTWNIRYYLFPEKTGSLKDIPGDIKKQFLSDEDKYRIQDPRIRKVVDEVVGVETNAYKVMRSLYDYVLDHMEYVLAGGWNVAPAVLERGSGSCSEYTFLFISLCRSAGLPARYVGSVVRRYDDASVDDVFHRWVEVYLPPYGWVPVDPNAGDKETPAERAKGIGEPSNALVVTTESGGDLQDLGWSYNSESRFITRGPTKVVEERYAEWEPVPEQSDE